MRMISARIEAQLGRDAGIISTMAIAAESQRQKSARKKCRLSSNHLIYLAPPKGFESLLPP
jgi:hypothetical protein